MLTDREHDWCVHASEQAGHFVAYFARACLHADWENVELIRPVLTAMIAKYPRYTWEQGPFSKGKADTDTGRPV